MGRQGLQPEAETCQAVQRKWFRYLRCRPVSHSSALAQQLVIQNESEEWTLDDDGDPQDRLVKT